MIARMLDLFTRLLRAAFLLPALLLFAVPGEPGGEPGDAEGEEGDSGEDGGDEDDGEDLPDDLGPKGKAALQAERAARKALKAELRSLRSEVKKVRREAEEARNANATDAEKAVAAARAEALGKASRQIVSAAVRAVAAGRLVNPKLAPRLIDLEQFEVDEDGNVDEDAIADALDAVIAETPALGIRKPGVKKSTTEGGEGRGAGGGLDLNTALRIAAKGA